jgi:hypothetical protein
MCPHQAQVQVDYNTSIAGLSRVIGSASVPLDYNVRKRLHPHQCS